MEEVSGGLNEEVRRERGKRQKKSKNTRGSARRKKTELVTEAECGRTPFVFVNPGEKWRSLP